jgi:hypothetical protein
MNQMMNKMLIKTNTFDLGGYGRHEKEKEKAEIYCGELGK